MSRGTSGTEATHGNRPTRGYAVTIMLRASLLVVVSLIGSSGCSHDPPAAASSGGTSGNSPLGAAGNSGGSSNPRAPSSGGSNAGGAAASGGNLAAGSPSLSSGGISGSSGGEQSLGGFFAGGSSSGGGPSSGAGFAGNAGTAGQGGAMTSGRFPFPQNARSARCVYPAAGKAEDALRAYTAWKSELITADGAGGHLRVRRPNSPGGETNSTVSEGIAYGMMLSVTMGDQALFDALWKYSQLWLDANGLMHWYINAAGTQVLGAGGATDSDEDIAWALVLADRQWGGSGSVGIPYLDLAKAQIDRVWNFEVEHDLNDLVLAGDTWGSNTVFNPSYFAPNEYRIFGEVSGNVAGWNRVIDTGYTILEKSLNAASGNRDNGLVPAWCDADGVPKEPFAGGPTHYQYDSARTPFRIGLDYCFSGEPRASAYLAKVSRFFSGVGAGAVVDGYDLNGAPRPDNDSPPGSPQSAVFLGSAAVGAQHDPAFRSFMDDAYARVATGQLLARSRYYNLSWTALTLLMLTGNLVEYR